MIEHIKLLKQYSKIYIDNQEVLGILPKKRMVIDSIVSYNIEDGEIVVVIIDNYALIYCNVMDSQKYYFCEIYDEGTKKLKYHKNESFVRSFKLAGEKYICTEENSFSIDDCQLGIYESESYYSFILINVTPISWVIYRGFEIKERDIKN